MNLWKMSLYPSINTIDFLLRKQNGNYIIVVNNNLRLVEQWIFMHFKFLFLFNLRLLFTCIKMKL